MRIYDSASNPYDFCTRCMPTAAAAKQQFGKGPDGPDGRGNCYSYMDDHPPYEYENYRCYRCHTRLKEEDN